MAEIRIAAVGDLLMKSEIIASCKQAEGYAFDAILEEVKPTFMAHDLTIGNLETTFSGKRQLGALGIRPKCNCPRERRNPKTGYPVFNCPDEFAATLKSTGFHVVTTANNHCMDGGINGLKRTLRILDQQGLAHTGTARSMREAKRQLIMKVKDVKVGILAYTKSTNAIPVSQRWLVNRLDPKIMAADMRELKNKTDFILVYLHFGKEYQTSPSREQKQLIRFLFKQGANVVVGAHPHVLHPVTQTVMKDIYGQVRTRVAASSLGNFVSSKLTKSTSTVEGLILSLTVTTNEKGVADISKVEHIPTIVERSKAGQTRFAVRYRNG
ncbi:CapA family protein [Paenibacillus sp. HWE-109]|uniref:CapA family protein n=1 Tax=Paenibacillus sp. HWE-109 TaxID=1306526 RepID=UPI001EE1050F|nr:CapA family protein [Paenibacillus sp. HWE-109]UKS25265.1 CapA family protein [Paenibacillus sp. HWE-109]